MLVIYCRSIRHVIPKYFAVPYVAYHPIVCTSRAGFFVTDYLALPKSYLSRYHKVNAYQLPVGHCQAALLICLMCNQV